MMNTITSQEFKNLAEETSVTVLDLRDPVFFDTDALESISNYIPITATQLPNALDHLEKKQTYYLFSQFGGQSKAIANFLAKHGFDVVNVIGGVTAYQQAVSI